MKKGQIQITLTNKKPTNLLAVVFLISFLLPTATLGLLNRAVLDNINNWVGESAFVADQIVATAGDLASERYGTPAHARLARTSIAPATKTNNHIQPRVDEAFFAVATKIIKHATVEFDQSTLLASVRLYQPVISQLSQIKNNILKTVGTEFEQDINYLADRVAGLGQRRPTDNALAKNDQGLVAGASVTNWPKVIMGKISAWWQSAAEALESRGNQQTTINQQQTIINKQPTTISNNQRQPAINKQQNIESQNNINTKPQNNLSTN